jgi:hypothetical protein
LAESGQLQLEILNQVEIERRLRRGHATAFAPAPIPFRGAEFSKKKVRVTGEERE